MQKPACLVQHTSDFRRKMSEYWDRCLDEFKKLKEEDKLLYDFFEESNTEELVEKWEKNGNENVRSRFDNRERLQKQYPEYAHILINKANKVKKGIFLQNHKPSLIDALSTYYERDFKTMTFTELEAFFQEYQNDEIFEGVTMPLSDFVDCKNSIKRNVPTLKANALGELVMNLPSKNLDNTNDDSFASLEDTKRSNLPVMAVSIVGIAVGVCCLVAAAIQYYWNRPLNSLENSNAEMVNPEEVKTSCCA